MSASAVYGLLLTTCPLAAPRFAPAWQSDQFADHHSTIGIDADQGRLTVRLDDQLISMSLHRVARVVQDEDDIYFENEQCVERIVPSLHLG